MDYLRTLGSAAVSTLVQKSGLNLPFSLGEKVASLDGICSLYDGTKRDDGSDVSVFEYDFSLNKKYAPLAKNALRKLRTIRHPDVLKFMDAVETETTIHIMTERVRPLQTSLQERLTKSTQEKEDWLIWGLHRISVALAFINESCASTHGNLRINSIFMSPSGEWRLGGFEVLSNPTDPTAVLYTMGGILPDALTWASPEIKQSGWTVLKEASVAAPDSYALGLLLNATFNPSNHPPQTANPPHPPPAASTRGNIPVAVFPLFKKLLNPNPKARLTSKGFLEIGITDGGFFSTNKLVKVCAGLDGFSVASEADKSSLLRTLNDSMGSFPPEFAAYRILPSLVSALEFGGVSAAVILPLVLQCGKTVSNEEYSTIVLTPLVKLYASPDRGTRMALLEHLPEYADRLDKKTVDSKVFPHLQTGFSDTVAVIREATVKAIILLAPKFSDRVLNNDLLRHLARLQQDPEASIRTNTCILIGRLGPSLGYNTKRKVLVPAFSRALKDVFVHARVAGIMAFMATIDCFDIDDLAMKVIPSVAPMLVDKEKLVRDQAFKAIDLFMKRLESHAVTLPDTTIPAGENTVVVMDASTVQGALVNSAAGAAGALAGWAMSSLGKRLVAADMQSTMSISGPEIMRPGSAPPVEGNRIGALRPKPVTTSFSAVNSTVSSPIIPTMDESVSRTKGMQLGANKSLGVVLAAHEWEEEASANIDISNSNPWGNDDLMDVNADADDWSAFETAPAAPTPVRGLNISPAIGRVPSPRSTQSRPSKPSANNLGVNTSPKATPPTNNVAAWDNDSGWDAPDISRTSSPSIPSSASVTLSKEEKALEMARRKEERRQRIAQLKEQKKHAMKS